MTLDSLSYASFKYSERILILSLLSVTSLGYYGFGQMILDQIAILFKVSISVRLQDIYQDIGAGKLEETHKMVVRETIILVIGAILVIPIVWLCLDFFVPLLLPKWVDGIFAGKLLILTLPFLVISNYAGGVTLSTLVNKIKYPPVFRLISTGTLIAGTYILNHYGLLSLESFIILSICGYAIFNLSMLVLYKKFFYDIYIKKAS